MTYNHFMFVFINLCTFFCTFHPYIKNRNTYVYSTNTRAHKIMEIVKNWDGQTKCPLTPTQIIFFRGWCILRLISMNGQRGEAAWKMTYGMYRTAVHLEDEALWTFKFYVNKNRDKVGWTAEWIVFLFVIGVLEIWLFMDALTREGIRIYGFLRSLQSDGRRPDDNEQIFAGFSLTQHVSQVIGRFLNKEFPDGHEEIGNFTIHDIRALEATQDAAEAKETSGASSSTTSRRSNILSIMGISAKTVKGL